MAALHTMLANTIVLFLLLLALWSLWLGIRGSGPTPGLRAAIVIALGAIAAQGAAGLVLKLDRPFDPFHVLYGVALFLSLPLAATLVRDRAPRGQSVALGLALLFAAGLAVRGITTGGG